MTNTVIEALKNRRSIRRYKAEQITEQELSAVLEAGIYAPTAKNLQSPLMVVVQDKETRILMSIVLLIFSIFLRIFSSNVCPGPDAL